MECLSFAATRQPPRRVSPNTDLQYEQDGADGSSESGGLSVDTFRNWNVSHLRACGHSMDIDLSKCKTQEDMAEAMVAAAIERPHVANYLASLAPLMEMSTSQLRALARDWGVKVSDCLEKGEMITRLVSASQRSSI